MEADKFKKIDDLNKTLYNINKVAYNTLSNLDDKSQKAVDDICERFSTSTNEKLSILRQEVIDILKEGYKASNEIISTFEPIVNLNPTDLGGVIDAINKIKKLYTKPYETAIEYVTVLTPKLTELATNIALLAYLPSQIPPIVNVNFEKLNITMEPITIADIIG